MPTVDRMIESVRSLAPLIEADRVTFDHTRQISPRVVAAMHDIGLFSLWLPRELDGPALSLADTARVLEILAQIDGAPAWCAGIATTYSRLGAFLPRATARKIFVEERAIVAGAFFGGQAEETDGGYVLSGRMPFSSGIGHSSWAIAGALIFQRGQPSLDEQGNQKLRVMLYPASKITVLDTWDVGGLRGTGSHDHTVEELFVPSDHTVIGHGDTTDCVGSIFRVPAYTAYPVPIAAIPLGIARNALDTFYKLATTKIPRSGTRPIREDASVQLNVGRAEAALRSARSFMFTMARELDAASEMGRISMEQRLMLRLACAHVAAASKDVVQIIYDAAGASSLYESNGIQRCFRDIHAAVQHLLVQSINFRWVGQSMMGLTPTSARL
jgi:alkylation response protein AidB-like acyl-CoA dehydrogenase